MGRSQKSKPTPPVRLLKLTKKEYEAKLRKLFKSQDQVKSREKQSRRETKSGPTSTESKPELITPEVPVSSPVNGAAVTSTAYSVEAALPVITVQIDQLDTGDRKQLSMPSLDFL